jgi:hypothetical protein
MVRDATLRVAPHHEAERVDADEVAIWTGDHDFALAGCWSAPDRAALVGAYAFEKADTKQEINLNPDGTYSSRLFKNGVAVWSISGKWEYETVAGETGVIFEKFKFGIEGYGAVGPGFWFVIPERALTGSIKLCFDSDLDYCFRRV